MVLGPALPQSCCVTLALLPALFCLSLLTCKMGWRLQLGDLDGGFCFRDAGSSGSLLWKESLSLCSYHWQGGRGVLSSARVSGEGGVDRSSQLYVKNSSLTVVFV